MSKFSNYNFTGQKALVRVDFNVPLDKQTFAITDDTQHASHYSYYQKNIE